MNSRNFFFGKLINSVIKQIKYNKDKKLMIKHNCFLSSFKKKKKKKKKKLCSLYFFCVYGPPILLPLVSIE